MLQELKMGGITRMVGEYIGQTHWDKEGDYSPMGYVGSTFTAGPSKPKMDIEKKKVRNFKEGMDVFKVLKSGDILRADNGYFMRFDSKLGSAIVPIEIADGSDFEPQILFELPKIPKELLRKIVSFFRSVFYKHKSEACVLLYLNRDKKDKYKIYVPEQEVSGGSVS